MKYFLNIFILLTILMAATPFEAQAACCTPGDSHQQLDLQKNHHEAPCGMPSCDCICCGSISLVPLGDKLIESEPQEDIIYLTFYYSFQAGSLFHSAIWQPPRLG